MLDFLKPMLEDIPEYESQDLVESFGILQSRVEESLAGQQVLPADSGEKQAAELLSWIQRVEASSKKQRSTEQLLQNLKVAAEKVR